MSIRFRIGLCLILGCFAVQPVRAASVISADDPAAEQFFDQAKAKAGFWKLMQHFESQVDQTYCGIASAVTVLNSLDVAAPASPAIYPYRRFDEDNIFTDAVLAIKAPKTVHLGGLTLDELGQVISTFGVKVEVHHADSPLDLEGFRTIATAALADPDARVIVNFERKALGENGEGHHSPLGAYDATSDRFLLLDVARYRLPPIWVSAGDLWAAMNTEDTDANAKRGFLVIHR
jgi:hypothetical protein